MSLMDRWSGEVVRVEKGGEQEWETFKEKTKR